MIKQDAAGRLFDVKSPSNKTDALQPVQIIPFDFFSLPLRGGLPPSPSLFCLYFSSVSSSLSFSELLPE